jgi:hypothetical protein
MRSSDCADPIDKLDWRTRRQVIDPEAITVTNCVRQPFCFQRLMAQNQAKLLAAGACPGLALRHIGTHSGFYQRGKRGYADTDVWNLCDYIAERLPGAIMLLSAKGLRGANAWSNCGPIAMH